MKIRAMTHLGVGASQLVLSILFLLGFFFCAAMEGLGYFKVSIVNNLREVLMLMMSFWFMRQRTSVDEPRKFDASRRCRCRSRRN